MSNLKDIYVLGLILILYSLASQQNSLVMSEKETSAENQSVESEVAGDEAVEEAKKRAILGSDTEADNPKVEAEANNVHVDDVEKGSTENCEIDKEDELLRGDDSKDEDKLEDSKEEDNVEDSKEDDNWCHDGRFQNGQ